MRFILALSLVISSLMTLAQSTLTDAEKFISNYQFDQALVILNASTDSLDINILQRKGYCLQRLGNYSDAINAYHKALSRDSLSRGVWQQLAQAYSSNSQLAEAIACYQKLVTMDSTNTHYLKQLGGLWGQMGDLPTSISIYKKAITINPRDVDAYIQVGNILLEWDNNKLADSLMTKGLSLFENRQVRLILAKAQLGEQKYDEVIKNTHMMLAGRDTIPVYARLLGISYFETHQYKKVFPCMQFLLRAGMKSEGIYYYLGVSYQQIDEPAKSIEYLNAAIEAGISENISTYYTQLAISYEDNKDFKNAIKYYKAAYESTKSDILLYHLARNCDFYFKDKSAAISYYKKYLSSDDTIKVAKEYSKHRLDELSRLR